MKYKKVWSEGFRGIIYLRVLWLANAELRNKKKKKEDADTHFHNLSTPSYPSSTQRNNHLHTFQTFFSIQTLPYSFPLSYPNLR
jgi:hypothetical protein